MPDKEINPQYKGVNKIVKKEVIEDLKMNYSGKDLDSVLEKIDAGAFDEKIMDMFLTGVLTNRDISDTVMKESNIFDKLQRNLKKTNYNFRR